MARKGKRTTKGGSEPQGDTEDKNRPSAGHNSELTDDQKQALHFRHTTEFEEAEKAKKDATTNFLNVSKRIKAEGGSVKAIKRGIALRTPAGEAAMKAEIEEALRIARWHGVAVGEQGALFPDIDRAPATEKAENEGKRDGMQGKPRTCPYDTSTDQYRSYFKGYDIGQTLLMNSGFKKPAAPDGDGPQSFADTAAQGDAIINETNQALAGNDDDQLEVPEGLRRVAEPAAH